MPANSTRNPGAVTSGIVLSLAAVRSQDDGRRAPVTASRLQPVVVSTGSLLASTEVTLGAARLGGRGHRRPPPRADPRRRPAQSTGSPRHAGKGVLSSPRVLGPAVST